MILVCKQIQLIYECNHGNGLSEYELTEQNYALLASLSNILRQKTEDSNAYEMTIYKELNSNKKCQSNRKRSFKL